MKSIKKLIPILSAVILTLVLCLCVTACGNADNSDGSKEGKKTITVDIVGSNGETKTVSITTESKYLRGALEQEKLVEGEESSYGLYVKTVNGERADSEKDGAYWAFYKGEDFLMSGIDSTPIADGDHFRIVYTKG